MIEDKTNHHQLLKHLIFVVGCSLALGAVFQAIFAIGDFWRGFIAASVLILTCGVCLYFSWTLFGRGKTLAWMMFLAFFLRLAYGVFLAWGLPRYGYETTTQQGGFVYEDPSRREKDAWELAKSDQPLSLAFKNVFETDQYGGMLAVSSFVYRTISLDAYRPALISILSAGAFALSVPFLVSAMRRWFDEKTAILAGWILALYPEGILLGSSQMREPFLILFFTMIFWGVSHVLVRTHLKQALVVLTVGALSLLLFSFRVAVPVFGIMFLWVWLMESGRLKITWLRIAGWGMIFLSLAVLYWFFRDWILAVLRWDARLTVLSSGQIQFQLKSLPEWLHLPFIVLNGLFQPALPANIAAPAPWIWRSLGIFRSLGWYALIPLLAYSVIRVWNLPPSEKKRIVTVMGIIAWVWILTASARAGGDQWDNPRYRSILLPWMAAVSAWGIHFARRIKDRWLTRGLIVEGIFLAFFVEWYISRYYPVIPRLNFWPMVGLIVLLSLAVVVGGWLRDRKDAAVALTDDVE